MKKIKDIFKPVILGLAMAMTMMSAQADITEKSIQDFVDQMQIAAKERNIDFFKTTIRDDAEFLIMIGEYAVNDEKALRLNKQQYITQTEQAFNTVESYESEVLALSQKIAKDKQTATVYATLREEMVIQNNAFTQKSIQVVRIIEEGRAIKITGVIAKIVGLSQTPR
jgi:fructose-specific component phosphotransferase system IIB-like protein